MIVITPHYIQMSCSFKFTILHLGAQKRKNWFLFLKRYSSRVTLNLCLVHLINLSLVKVKSIEIR